MTTTTERQPINRKNFTEAIRAAVEERGADWIYPKTEPGWVHLPTGGGCRYFLTDGQPACIIGTALAKLGYGPADVKEGAGASWVLNHLTTNDALVDAACHAQGAQDNGQTWGQALTSFEKTLARWDALLAKEESL